MTEYIYIMRQSWHNYESGWHEGAAYRSLNAAKAEAYRLLELNYQSDMRASKRTDGEMIFHETGEDDFIEISVARRVPGKADLFFGSAEIYKIPLVLEG